MPTVEATEETRPEAEGQSRLSLGVPWTLGFSQPRVSTRGGGCITAVSDIDTDQPASETPGGVWPPAPQTPQAALPDLDGKRQVPTLTPYGWLDLVLGLPAGFLGALLVFCAIGILGDLVSPPPESNAKVRFEFWVPAALSAATCVVLVRRAPLFGIALTTGALIFVMITSIFVWLL